ncbi:Uncharacterised protein [uncultured archaeon]|nr:Uncharacterised protein [uncultured archaeon]
MKELLRLSRQTLESYFQGKDPEVPQELVKNFSKRQACFVSLTKNGKLRGCIGSLEPKQVLYKDLIENIINAAFHDPRFPPLKKEELPAIKIEVSLLSVAKPLVFADSFELLRSIHAGVDGVIIQKGYASATYLPQVWEDMPNKEEFLGSLCIKAGLDQDAWRKPGMKVSVYRVKNIKEE